MHWTPKIGTRTRGRPPFSLMETYWSDGEIRTGFNDIKVDNLEDLAADRKKLRSERTLHVNHV